MVNVSGMISVAKIGSRVRQLRKLRGMTQSELAEAIGRRMDAISMIERGKSLPSLDTLAALSSAMNVPIETLIATDDGLKLNRERRELVDRASAILSIMSDEQLKIAVQQLAVLVLPQKR